MFSEALRELDRNTEKYMVEQLHNQVVELQSLVTEKDTKLAETQSMLSEKNAELSETKTLLSEKDAKLSEYIRKYGEL